MQVIKSEMNIYFDCDDTLVIWGKVKKKDKYVRGVPTKPTKGVVKNGCSSLRF